MREDTFAGALLGWFDLYGRTSLPWQINPTPYRVWVSEIMLQQTQVNTVIDYYLRFMARFPDVVKLAQAHQDEVLHLWSGLGYYARGRNLHRAARIVCEHHGAELPDNIDALQALPGIGRSTAGAILALARGERHAILDGNVKRVLCRYHAIEGWPGKSGVNHALWRLAETHTPNSRVAHYTQAIMDLGATVCTRTRPLCDRCPLAAHCKARHQSLQSILPSAKPKKNLPVRETTFLLINDGRGRFLLEKRPPTGIWGGLWGFPECQADIDPSEWVRHKLGRTVQSVSDLPLVRHGFTHYHLNIHPVMVILTGEDQALPQVAQTQPMLWHDGTTELGLPAPVSKLLAKVLKAETITK